MKVAITSKGKSLDSEVDPRFGRAAFILVVDTESFEFEALDNSENVNAFKGAGIQAASMVGDKGAYALAPIRPRMQITHDDVISWNSFKEKPKDHRTLGFLSQVSPDGQYAVTTLNEELYVANFLDYRFLQVFYDPGDPRVLLREERRDAAAPWGR